MHKLISSWRQFQPYQAPYLFPEDGHLLGEEGLYCRYADWNAFVKDPDFGDPDEGRSQLHFDLLPAPFVGNLKTASVFLLMLNPGFGPHDYFGEYEVPEFRNALLNNLHQTPNNSFLFLDPRFSWHGGYDYWHTKLKGVIKAFANKMDIPYGRARRFFQAKIAALELVPYHSENFGVPDRVISSLPSAQLAQTFVHEELVPRARSGKCLLVVTRGVSKWKLAEHKNIVMYGATEARSAHLSPESRGGKAIFKFLSSAFVAEGDGNANR